MGYIFKKIPNIGENIGWIERGRGERPGRDVGVKSEGKMEISFSLLKFRFTHPIVTPVPDIFTIGAFNNL